MNRHRSTRNHRLVEHLLRQEEALRHTSFLAPCVAGGRIRVRIDALVHEFKPRPADFEGWGVFRAVDSAVAELVQGAAPCEVERYTKRLPTVRLRLVRSLRGQAWLACPVNHDDAQRRLGHALPRPLHLVAEGIRFEVAKARWDGANLWFEDLDRGGDPRVADRLREAFGENSDPNNLRWSGLTPEDHTAYKVAVLGASPEPQPRRLERDEDRLRRALERGGGALRDLRDRGEHWQVEWADHRGHTHTSAVAKGDFTVLSGGLCLSGLDEAFDLTSLVGVVEQAPSWAF